MGREARAAQLPLLRASLAAFLSLAAPAALLNRGHCMHMAAALPALDRSPSPPLAAASLHPERSYRGLSPLLLFDL